MEITCEQIRAELVNYFEPDVSDETRALVNDHTAHCSGCRAVYDGVRNVLQLVAGDVLIEMPEGFSRRLRHRLGLSAA